MDNIFSPNPEGPVLVIGSASIDMIGRVRIDLEFGTSTPAEIRTSFGGTARNVAENLAHLGQPVTLLTVVGNDRVGEQLIHQTESAGVDTSRVMMSDSNPTGSYLGVLNPKGELQFALDDMRAIRELLPEYIEAQKDLFYTASAIFIDANLDQRSIKEIVKLAKRAKLNICADPTSSSLAQKLESFLPNLVLVTPNSAEASVFCKCEIDPSNHRQGLDLAKLLVNHGVEIAVVTMAEFGVCYATSETSGHIPAIRTEICDPTGAGDAFTAAVMFALLNEFELDDAMRLGVSAASLTMRVRGAVRPDLTLESLYNHLVI